MNRKIAIVNMHQQNTANAIDIAKTLAKYDSTVDVTIFNAAHTAIEYDKCVVVDDAADTETKVKNFVVRWHKDNGFDRFLHVIEDSISIDADPSKFLNDIEHMMDIIEVGSWFGTVCDGCNYLYKKYMPRVSVDFNEQEEAKLGMKSLLFTSNANTYWTAYNMKTATDEELYFNEAFTMPMFYIISYLAGLRNNKAKGAIRYMNQYPTVPTEQGVYRINNTVPVQYDVKANDDVFKSLMIDHHPDNNIDTLLEDVYAKVKPVLSR